MKAISTGAKALCLMTALALPVAGSLSAQEQEGELVTTVYGSGMTDGPEIEGIISARSGNQIQITTSDGQRQIVTIDEDTEVKSSGGFLGLGKNKLNTNSLINGLPVKVETLSWDGGLVASKVDLKSKDLKLANMIHNGTDQRFAEQTAATEALRGRVGDIDQYNVKGTTNVYFDTGKYNLTGQAQSDLCSAAAQAEATDNALLLVVGYTDSTGDYEFNQELSEKRAARVVNYLQQNCGWKPYRMLSPTGMASADPAADNYTDAGKAQNRRVAVNILVSKAVDGM